MRGLGFKRGPLKPAPSVRKRLIAHLLAMPVLRAAASMAMVLIGGEKFEEAFLPHWFAWTPLFIAVIFGPIFGRRLAGAVGYHWSYLASRSLEIACVLAAFAIFALAATSIHPVGLIFPALWAGFFLVLCAFDFTRALMAK
jgi:hypothetical protein